MHRAKMEKHAVAFVIFLAIGSIDRSTAQILDLGILPVNLLFEDTIRVTQIDCYIQSNFAGEGETSYEIAAASITGSSSTQFGELSMFDDLVTEGANPESNVIGQAEGLFASADLNTPGYFLDYNLFFTSGSYNGSTLHIVGRDTTTLNIRELSVAGGTEYFRLATGFVYLTTISGNRSSTNYTFQLNITVYQPILL